MKKNLLKLIVTVYLVSSILILGSCEGLFGSDEDIGSYLGDDNQDVPYQINLIFTDLPSEYNNGNHFAIAGLAIGNSKNRKTVAGVVKRAKIEGDTVTLPLMVYNTSGIEQPFQRIGDFSIVFIIQKVERNPDNSIKEDENGKQIFDDEYSGTVTMPITGENTYISIHELSPF